MFTYNLSEKFNVLKKQVIDSILFAFKDAYDKGLMYEGNYIFISGDLNVILTENGSNCIDFIKWDGNDVTFHTEENKIILLSELCFEDLLYFYEIIEGADDKFIELFDAI